MQHPAPGPRQDANRAETDAGRGEFATEDGEFSIADHHAFLAANDASIRSFRDTQTRAFEEEKARWRLSGEFDVRDEPAVVETVAEPVPPGATAVTAPFTSTVWRVDVRPGDDVAAGDAVLAVEAMKMESVVGAPVAGRVLDIRIKPGEQVAPGQVLAVIGAAS